MEDELPAVPLLPWGGEFCLVDGMAHSVAQLVALQVHVLEALFNRLHQTFGLKDAAEERHLHLKEEEEIDPLLCSLHCKLVKIPPKK